MYGKLFDSIYDGTLAQDWRALITFQQMIILCDREGVVDMTPEALSRRTGIPIEHIEAGIAALESPDEKSRSPELNGRRIVRLDDHRTWGWRIVNHAKYREMRSPEDRRAYMRKYMRDRRENDRGNHGSGKQPELTGVNKSLREHTSASALLTSSGSKKGARRKPAIPIPDDFALTDDLVAHAAKLGITNRKRLEQFTDDLVDQCRSKDYRYVDYKAVWRKWLRTDIREGRIAKDPPIQRSDT